MDEREFWKEIHRGLDVITRAIVKHKLSRRDSDAAARQDDDEARARRGVPGSARRDVPGDRSE